MPPQKPITIRSKSVAASGYTLIELACVLALATTVGAVTLPGVLTTLDEARTIGAVRYMSARLQRARMEAVMRSADVSLKITLASAGRYRYVTYVDGNRNGVRATDILRDVDSEIMPPESLADLFSGVDFGVLPGLPAVDSGSSPPGTDPVHLGRRDVVTFTPRGTSTPGSLYIVGPRRRAQYVIRIFGDTAKTRVLKFNPHTGRWTSL